MSDITFIVANKRSNTGVPNGAVGSKYFSDCTISVQHSFPNSVTEHPVENGASFSDHVQQQNSRFTVSGIFSDIPLNQYAGDSLPLQDRIRAAYDFLHSLRKAGTKFTFVSKFASYPNCVIESLDIPSDVEGNITLRFDLSIVQIRTATTSLVNIVQSDVVADFKKDDAAKGVNSGKQNPTDNRRTSVAKQIADSSSQATELVSNIFGVSEEDAAKAITDPKSVGGK
jgi:hypothetical protein